jgi:signal transduction histidine kinase
MKQALLCCSICLLCTHHLLARQTPPDSLYQKLSTPKRDSVTVKTLIKLAETYSWTVPDSGLYYAQQAIEENKRQNGAARLSAAAWNAVGYASYMKGQYTQSMEAFRQYYQFARKANDKIHMAFALNNEGNIHIELGDYGRALDLYKEALSIRQAARDSAGIAMSYNNIGFIYKDIGDYEKAQENFFYSLREYEKLGDQKAVGKTHNFIAIVYARKKENQKAIDHLEQAIALQKATNDVNELAISYQTLSSIYATQGKNDEALEQLRLAMEIYQSRGDIRQTSMVYADQAEIFLQKKQYDSAGHYYQESIRQNLSIGNKRNLASPWLGLAQAQTALKQYAAARASLDSALQIVNETRKKEDLRRYYEVGATYYAAVGDHQQAFQYQQQLTSIKDSLLNEQNVKAIADMEVKYQTEKKEQAILLQQAEIERKNIILWSAAALFLLAAGLAISTYRRYRLKQQARLQQEILNQQEMATRAVIKAEEDERQRIARDLHDGVGQMMSAAKMNLSAFESNLPASNPEQTQSLDKIIALVDESCREIRAVSHNMMPNALLKNSLASAVRDFIDKIDKRALKVHIYTEGLDERLDSNVETVLYRVIQECVNNVIKHSGASTLDISINRDADGISATIEDNGKGFNTQDKSRFEGIGLKNIITRIEYLKGTVDFDSAPGRGTLVAIHVPLGSETEK